MSHSLLRADFHTHVKIVALALAGSISLILLSIGSWHLEPKASTAQARAEGPVLKAGKAAISATVGAPIIR